MIISLIFLFIINVGIWIIVKVEMISEEYRDESRLFNIVKLFFLVY